MRLPLEKMNRWTDDRVDESIDARRERRTIGVSA
jgi:hypothetical protein